MVVKHTRRSITDDMSQRSTLWGPFGLTSGPLADSFDSLGPSAPPFGYPALASECGWFVPPELQRGEPGLSKLQPCLCLSQIEYQAGESVRAAVARVETNKQKKKKGRR